jgi:hypothetical protein
MLLSWTWKVMMRRMVMYYTASAKFATYILQSNLEMGCPITDYNLDIYIQTKIMSKVEKARRRRTMKMKMMRERRW